MTDWGEHPHGTPAHAVAPPGGYVEPYRPPTSRREAVDEILRSGYTTSALLAVALGFPLDGEVAETANSKLGRMLLRDYGDEACRYLAAWGRNSCALDGRGSRPELTT